MLTEFRWNLPFFVIRKMYWTTLNLIYVGDYKQLLYMQVSSYRFAVKDIPKNI
jgi:hypothetical protein